MIAATIQTLLKYYPPHLLVTRLSQSFFLDSLFIYQRSVVRLRDQKFLVCFIYDMDLPLLNAAKDQDWKVVNAELRLNPGLSWVWMGAGKSLKCFWLSPLAFSTRHPLPGLSFRILSSQFVLECVTGIFEVFQAFTATLRYVEGKWKDRCDGFRGCCNRSCGGSRIDFFSARFCLLSLQGFDTGRSRANLLRLLATYAPYVVLSSTVFISWFHRSR